MASIGKVQKEGKELTISKFNLLPHTHNPKTAIPKTMLHPPARSSTIFLKKNWDF